MTYILSVILWVFLVKVGHQIVLWIRPPNMLILIFLNEQSYCSYCFCFCPMFWCAKNAGPTLLTLVIRAHCQHARGIIFFPQIFSGTEFTVQDFWVAFSCSQNILWAWNTVKSKYTSEQKSCIGSELITTTYSDPWQLICWGLFRM